MDTTAGFSACAPKVRDVPGFILMKDSWIWYGNAGHLCVSNSCRFHLCTKIGQHLVSTVGEYYKSADLVKQRIGSGEKDYYETMVFKCGDPCECGCGLPDHDGSELECFRYSNAKDASEGHLKVCEFYDKIESESGQLLIPDPLRKSWNEWVRYRKEMRHPLRPNTIKRQLAMIAKYSPDQGVEMIDRSMTNGWIGLFPPRGVSRKEPLNYQP